MNAGRDAGWQTAARVLCVRLDSLGDVLMCTPAMHSLRAAAPGRTLTLLASPSGAAAAPYIPDLDDVIVYEAPWMKVDPGRVTPKPAGPGPGLAFVERLASARFDAAVIFTTYTQSALPAALLCQLAGIPLRAAHCRENPYGLLSDWVPDPEPATCIRHEVQRQLALVRHVGASCPQGAAARSEGLSFVPRAADFAAARASLARAGVAPDGPWLLLHPGASAASRRYPPAHWARAIVLLHEQVGLPLVLTGGAMEAELVERIRAEAAVPTHSLAGELGLGALGAALSLATVAITNNSGPAHIAAAVGTPVVNLYALTNPQHTPWNVPSRVLFHDVPCRFCFKSACPAGHHACLDGVAPQRVADAVMALMQHGLRRYHKLGNSY